MKWNKFPDEEPPCAEDVLVIKQYLDAPYDEHGYHPDKSFWTKPVVAIDSFWSDKRWYTGGGKITHWMKIPKLPEEKDAI